MAGLGLLNRRRAISSSPTEGDPLKKVLESCVGWYTFEGRSNSDADRAIVYDQSGKGNNMTLYNMQWTSVSQYEAVKSGYYEDCLWMFPSNWEQSMGYQQSYGKITMTPLNEVTIIVNRSLLPPGISLENGFFAWTCLIGSGEFSDANIFFVETKNDSSIFYNTFRGLRYYGKEQSEVIWMNGSHYCGHIMTGTPNTRVHDGVIYLNKLRGDYLGKGGWLKLKGLYIFNRQLTPNEIEEFIHEYVDSTYVMPEIE